jgi:uncharacterized protein (DUF1330 family)
MKYYAVAEIEITDRSPAYVKTVTRMVERYGGRYRARTSSVEKIEGDRKPPQIALIVEWPSRDAAQAFYDCQEYRPYRQSRLAGAKNEFLLVAGEDMTKTTQISD